MRFNQINKNDFVLVLRPVIVSVEDEPEDLMEWTGEIQIQLFADLSKSTLNKYEMSTMENLCSLLAAAVPALNENAFIRYVVNEYAELNSMELEHMDIVEHAEKVTEGNVIKLKFDSDTKGNA
tara:strand:- start:1107 stop:1475 length:369 start_codon:yes stop_codon:yes gene_type:complete